MSRILIFIEHKENRRLLAEWLALRHEVVIAQTVDDLNTEFDCGIFDGVALSRCSDLLHARRKASEPQFLPCLLITSRQDLRMTSGHLWQTTDELIFTPIEKLEMLARIEILLRAREFSLQLGEANTELRQQVVEREAAQAALHQSLTSTTELYEVTHKIAAQNTPPDILRALMLCSCLQMAHYAALEIFDTPWTEEQNPARTVIASAARGVYQDGQPARAGANLSSLLNAVDLLEKPLIVDDARTDPRLDSAAREWFEQQNSGSIMLMALVARGNWYGIAQFHAQKSHAWSEEDAWHVQQLVESAALCLDNLRLLAAEVEARHQAEQADRSKLQFLGMISHELRTPLASIKGFSSSLLADDVTFDAEAQNEFLHVIDEEADKLNDLVGQLLDLSRLQAGALRISPAPHQIADILTEAKSQLEVLTAQFQFEVYVPDDLPIVMVDVPRMAQVLTNLVGNAVKYSPEHSLIRLSAYARSREIVVEVADQGIGIPPEERTLVFEAFRQIERKEARFLSGAGLGLAICRALVEAHGGQIWIADHSGPGTTMAFTLPVLAV